MILPFVLMMTTMFPCAASNSFIMDPMKGLATHRAVQKVLEFKHNVLEHLWSRTTPKQQGDQIYRLPRLRFSPLKYYRPEPLNKNSNLTQVYPKGLLLVTPKKENNKDSLGYPYGQRYAFYQLNNLDKNAKNKFLLHVNRFPVKMNQQPNLQVIDVKNQLPTRYQTRIISSAEIDPQNALNGTITLEIPKGKIKRENGLIRVKIPYIKNILSGKSSYPRCLSGKKLWPLLGRYELSNKKKVEKRSHDISCCGSEERKMKREVWPLLGVYNQAPLSQQTHIHNGLVGQLSPGLANKRNNEMQLINKISEMKAKEHIAEDNRLSEMHNTQEAKREFQESIAEQLDLLSEAKRADLRAKRAFEKVVKLERNLSKQDRELHRLKEQEDKLYEELLESEAQVAMADMEIIPKFINEEDLQEFMSGPKFNLDVPH